MTKKKRNILIGAGIGLFFGVIFTFNIYTYTGIKTRTGYAYGTIIKNWESGKHRHDYSRYQYQVDGIFYQGRQGDEFPINSVVVIVYDQDNPKYSMIADYSFPLINQDGDTLPINEKYVKYSWWNYLPGDNISVLWK